MDNERDPLIQPRSPRLNPFAFPSDTDFRFVLLIATVVGVSIFYFFLLYLNSPVLGERWTLKMDACSQEVFGKSVTDLDFTQLDPSLASTYLQCTALAQLEWAGWTIAGMIGILVLAGIIYWAYPSLIIRRAKLAPLTANDAPEVVAYLDHLCLEIGLSRQPAFVWDPLNPVVSGLAFGRRGRYYVALSGGLVTWFYTDLPAFRAILMHELAHLKNADVDKSYFAVAIWPAFLLFAIVPYVTIMIGRGYYDLLPSIAWYVVTLGALVYLMRAAVLRSREYYADVRASTWDEASGALERSLESLSQNAGRRLGVLNVHPEPADRLRILADTGSLFRLNFWIAVGMGVSLSISLPLISQWLDLLGNAGWISPTASSFILAMLFATLVMGVVGVGLWRATFAAQMTGKTLVGAKRSALGLALGFVMGESVYYGQIIPTTSDGLGSPIPLAGLVNNFAFELIWAASLAALLYLVFWWISSSAQVWLAEAAGMDSPRPVYIFGLMLAGGISAGGVGLLLLLRKIVGSMVITSTTQLLALIQALVALIIRYLQHPVTFILLSIIWAFPMSAWLLRRRPAPLLPAKWAFLGEAAKVLPRQELRPGLAVGVGLSAGAIYLVMQIVLRILLIALGVADTIYRDQASLVWLFIGHLVLAVLLQVVAAAGVTYLVKQTGWAHGLLAAFCGGCMMAVGYVVFSLLFGDSMDIQTAWLIISTFVNSGALASLPLVLAVAAISHRIRSSAGLKERQAQARATAGRTR